MIIRTSEIKSTEISEIIKELESNKEVMDIIKRENLRAGDVLEAMATDLLYDDNDIDTDNYLDIC